MDWAWDPTLFAGAAQYYDSGRAPYAPGLAHAFAAALGLDGTGRLLDVGCGPGSVTLLLAPHFASVVGLDPDPGMLSEAKRLAAERNISNATWVLERAENLPAGLGRFRVVTFAASFHWLDRELVARVVHGMLEPGGALVHIDNHHQDGLDPLQPGEFPPVPAAKIDELVRSYLGPKRRAGQSVRETSPSNEAAIFLDAGFAGPASVVVPDGRILERTIDQVVANVFSMSSSAPHLFAGRLSSFEQDLCALLHRESPSGRFLIQLPDNELKIWRPV